MDDLSRTTARAEESHRRIDDLKAEIKLLKANLSAVEDFAYSIRGFIRVIGWLSLICGFIASYLKLNHTKD